MAHVFQIHFALETRGKSITYCWNRLQRLYPKLKTLQGVSPLLTLLEDVFPEGLPKQAAFSNRSYTASKGMMKRIGLRPFAYQEAGDPLFSLLGPGKTLLLLGFPMSKSFLINAVHVVENAPALDGELDTTVIRRKREDLAQNALDGLIEEIPSLAEPIRQKLKDWMDYPVWERDAEEHLMTGCRYTEWRVERFQSRQAVWQMVFTVIADSKEAFDLAHKGFRSDAAAAPLQVSKDTWSFQFIGMDDLRKLRGVTPLPLGAMHKPRELSDAKKHRTLRTCGAPFPEPYIVEIPISIPDNWQKETEVLEAAEDVKAVLQWKGIQEQGFLMRSTATLTLMNRLIYEAQRFEEGDSSALNLAQVLFDAKNARLPQHHAEITEWQNKAIAENDNQRAAVQKMLDAPDLCLIQGPPGTGKTTVIAEGIFQCVQNGERVLLSSQSNDAVDNALDRLSLRPDIRPLRIQNEQRRNADDATFSCAENAVLHRFYHSLAKGVEATFLAPWASQDAELVAAKEARMNQKLHASNLVPLRTHEQALRADVDEATQSLAHCKEILSTAREEQALCRKEASGRNLMQAAKTSDGYTSFSLSARQTRAILPILNRVLATGAEKGVFLLKELKSIPEESAERQTGALAVYRWNLRLLHRTAARAKEAASGPSADERLPALEQERARLLENVPDPTDSIAASTWQKAFFQVTNDIQKAKDSGQFLLDDSERAMLSEELAATVHENPGTLASVLEEVLPNADAAWDTMVQMLTAQAPAEPEMAPLQRKVQDAENRLAYLTSKLADVQTRVQQEEQAIASAGTAEALEARCRAAQAAIDDAKDVRDIWEPILKEYHAKLLDEKIAQQDSEAGASNYLDIYKDSCNVIGATCTANQRDVDGLGPYDVAIIDEVSKATPIELLIPMRRARRSILVGDHRQLPPQFRHTDDPGEALEKAETDNEESTLTHASYEKFKDMVGRSLFKEAFACADPAIKHSLLTQYRMHPDIMDVINVFYDHRLECGYARDVADQRMAAGLTIPGEDHCTFVTPQTHAYWIDSGQLPDGEKTFEDFSDSSSAKNTMEQVEIVELVKKLAAACRAAKTKKTLGIICFYRQQVREIKWRLNALRREKTCDFSYLRYTVNTVDRFQGQERNIIICSLTRNPRKKDPTKISKFVKTFERINVAFSRAQQLLFIVGAAETFRRFTVPIPRLDAEGTVDVKVYDAILDQIGCSPSSRLIGKTVLPLLKKELSEQKGKMSA